MLLGTLGLAVPRRPRPRVVVERILPEVDGGRFPIKRTVGESVRVLAWAVNRIRHDNPALHSNDSLTLCPTDNPQIIAFYKRSADRSNAIFVVVNLDYERVAHVLKCPIRS